MRSSGTSPDGRSSLPPPAVKPSSVARKACLRLLAIGVGLAISVVLAEVVFRALDIRPPAPPPADQVDAFAVKNEVNELGLREPPGFPPPRVPGEWRIAVLGDSMTYGEGVESEQAFPAVLARMLARRNDGRTYTVINMGWLGDNTAAEAARYRKLADRIDPDLLVLMMYVNDFAHEGRQAGETLHRIYSIRDDVFVLSEFSYLFHYVERTIRLRRAFDETMRYYRADALHGVEPAALDPVAREIVALRDFAASRETRFAVAFLPMLAGLHDYQLTAMHDCIAELCRAEGIPFRDLAPAFADRDERAMRVSLANHHPSPAAHEIVATDLIEFLRETRLIPDGIADADLSSRSGR